VKTRKRHSGGATTIHPRVGGGGWGKGARREGGVEAERNGKKERRGKKSEREGGREGGRKEG